MTTTNYEQKKQIDWLAILRGLAVALVIIYHVPTAEVDGMKAPFEIFNDIFVFRMPLFFFISGYLLFYTKVRKNGSFASIIKERVPRVVIPYIFITLSVLFIKYFVGHVVGIDDTDISLSAIANIFLYPRINNPWVVLWFLNSVLIFFLCYPLLKLSLKNIYSSVGTLLLLISLHYFFPEHIMLLDLYIVFLYFVFFYFGMFFARFDFQKYAKRNDVFLICIAVMVLIKTLEYNKILDNTLFIYSIPGIFVLINLAMRCEKVRPTLFKSFRKYYYQIYLYGKFFQSPIFILFGIFGNNNIALAIGCFLLSISLGLYGPVFLARIVEKINWKPLLRIFGF